MKLSIIMPTCDVPIGSGKPYHFLKDSMESVRAGGYDDFECLVGCDGNLPKVRAVVDSMADARFKYIPFPATHTWGNFQRHELMEKHADGDYFMFMDHDDAYVEGALRIVADEIHTLPGRAFIFRALLACNIVLWSRADPAIRRNVVNQGMAIPRGYPRWSGSERRDEDSLYARSIQDHCNSIGSQPIWATQIIAHIRPWAPAELVPFNTSHGGAPLVTT